MLIKQYKALLETEGINLEFTTEALTQLLFRRTGK